jgi:hypothetical protein
VPARGTKHLSRRVQSRPLPRVQENSGGDFVGFDDRGASKRRRDALADNSNRGPASCSLQAGGAEELVIFEITSLTSARI